LATGTGGRPPKFTRHDRDLMPSSTIVGQGPEFPRAAAGAGRQRCTSARA